MLVINAAANFWKHVDEWNRSAVALKDKEKLRKDQKPTISTIENVSPWGDYTCSNLLFELTPNTQFADVLPILEQWRGELHSQFG